MSEKTFQSVELYAVQKPETHRTVAADRSIQEETLPGLVELGFVLDGVRVPLAKLKAGGILADIARHKAAQTPAVETRGQ